MIDQMYNLKPKIEETGVPSSELLEFFRISGYVEKIQMER